MTETPFPETTAEAPTEGRITRVGPLPVVRRELTVKAVIDLTPTLRRITLAGEALEGFHSPGADDHVKLFFPAPQGQEEGARRDYTPRAHRPDVRELDLDFVLHGHGPGASWAAQARPGQTVTVGGPRGSTRVSYTFDWYLLAGDDAALPAIARRLEELPAGANVTVLLEVQDAASELPLPTQAHADVRWLHRGVAEPGTTSLLPSAVRALSLCAGEGFVWVGTEQAAAASIRAHLLEERGLRSEYVRCVGYWTRNAPQE